MLSSGKSVPVLVSIVVSLSGLSTVPAQEVRGGAQPSAPTILAQASAEADTTEKRRVRKEQPKPAASAPASEAVVEESKDSGGCLGGCLGGFFASLLSDDSETTGDEEIVTSPGFTSGVADAPLAAENLRPLPYGGVVTPVNPHAEDVGIWLFAGGREESGEAVARLPAGTHVQVNDRKIYENVIWVKVAVPSRPGTAGWMREYDVETPSEAPLAATHLDSPAQVSEADKETFVAGPPLGELVGGVAFPLSTESSINEEYSSAAEFGAEGRWFVRGGLNVQLGFAYLWASGKPQFNYEIGSVVESPSDSRLDVWRFDLAIGQQIYFRGKRGFVAWGLGPALFDVRERADITVLDSNDTVIGRREEKLSVWKLGGQVRLGGGGVIGERVTLAGYARFALFPWDAKREKSLTLDFVDSKSIGVFTFGLTVGYRFF